MKKQTYEYEFTDTYAGEANYCWVKRGEVTASSYRGAITAAKRKLGITARHIRYDYGDAIRCDFPGACVVLFIS